MMTSARAHTRLLIGIAALGPWLLAGTDAPVYRGYEVFRDLRDDPRGIGTAASAAAAVATADRTLQVTPRALQAYAFADQVIQGVDFGQVMQTPLALGLPDGTRAFAISGRQADQAYVLDYHAATVDQLAVPRFLAFAADLRVQEEKDPIPGEARGYGVALHARAHAGELSHQTLGRLLAGTLRVLAPDNLPRLPSWESPLFKNTRGRDAQALAELFATLPETARLLDKYFVVSPNLKVLSANGTAYTRADVKLVPRLDALERDHPRVAAYVRRLIEGFELSARTRYRLKSGLTACELSLDSRNLVLGVSFDTTAGRLLPRDAAGHPRFDASLDLAAVEAHEGEVRVDFAGNINGLSVRAEDIVVSTRYRDGGQAELLARVTRLPTPSIDGAAFGVFPDWAIDLAIPGNLEGYMRDFTAGVLRGGKARGTYMKVGVDTRAPASTMLLAEGSIGLIDNFFISFGMRMVQSYVWPSPDVIRDAWALARESSFALEHDLVRLVALEPSMPQRPLADAGRE